MTHIACMRFFNFWIFKLGRAEGNLVRSLESARLSKLHLTHITFVWLFTRAWKFGHFQRLSPAQFITGAGKWLRNGFLN